ncbi:MAG: hypothetical protein JWR25_368 [Noviherbaspirillum sp.]|nr:hypothetical protein [Noviherbaspirillum sp.]
MELCSVHHLGALVQDARAGTGRGQPLAIALDKIIPGENPRTTFDAGWPGFCVSLNV